MNVKRWCHTCKYGDLPLDAPICEECLSPEYQNWFPKTTKTNADRIRAMTDEELAVWLDDISKACYDEGYTKETDEPLMSPYPSTASKWMAWLKQEATNGETE